MTEEIWKEINDYPNYMVSNMGRVKSLNYRGNTNKEHLLIPHCNTWGYPRVILCKNGVIKSFSVHRLVAQAFLPNPDNLPCINHKDCIKTNNVYTNLEWCTYSYNNAYNDAAKDRAKNRVGKTQPQQVKQMSLDGKLIMIWPSIQSTSEGGYQPNNIWKVIKGKRNKAHGFTWALV